MKPIIAKQALIDIMVVIVIPALLVGASFALKSADVSLLSFVSPSSGLQPGEEGAQLGAKTKAALATLRTIDLDPSLFKDPAYLALQEQPITVATSTLGRPYPFIPPPVIANRLLRHQSSGTAKPAASIDVSTKIDILKK